MAKGSRGFKANEYFVNAYNERSITTGNRTGNWGARLHGLEPWERWGLSFSALALTSVLLTGCAVQSPAGHRASAAEGERVGETATSSASLSPEIPPAPGQSSATEPAPTAPTPDVIPDTMALAATTADAELLTKTNPGDHQGRFRVGNQTQHPLRIAFLQQSDGPSMAAAEPPVPQKSSAGAAKSPANASATMPPSTASQVIDLEPIHWDFAPGEGGQSGLLLSVPQGDVELRNGDVLVAFAQDGSRRYWGPYVVGQTQLPYWNEARSEWQLLIQP